MSFIVPVPYDGERVGDLIDELAERGYHGIARNRLLRFLNDGCQRFARHDLWPFLFDQANGTAPLEIADLRAVQHVRINAQRGSYLHRLAGRNPDEEGAPLFWRLANPATVTTWPVDTTAELSVDYWRKYPRHADEDETVLIPASHSGVLLDCAHLEAAKDARDWENVAGLRQEVKDGLDAAVDELIDPQEDANEVQQPWGED